MAETPSLSTPTSGGRWWRVAFGLSLLFLLISVIYVSAMLIDTLSNGVVV